MARWKAASAGSEIESGLGRCCEGSDRLDADDSRDRSDLEPAPGLTEVLLDGAHIEPAADLLRAGDGELLTGYRQKSPPFELVLKRLALGFGAFENGVGWPIVSARASLERL
jgi:hypothetical protein